MTFDLPGPTTLTGSLAAGFAILVIGLAVLGLRRAKHRLQSAAATRRALLYALVIGLSTASFAQVISPALLGERSPFLLALADVIFVTLALCVLVVILMEGHSAREIGYRPLRSGRLLLVGVMAIGAAAVYAFDAYAAIFRGAVPLDQDRLVFAALASTLGSALPEETLFRGYLMGSLDVRTRRWTRVMIAALAFTAFRGLRFAPTLGLGSPAWMIYVFGVVLPLGLWWGLMRELAGGAIWPSLASHVLLEFGVTLAGAHPALP